MLIRDGNGEKGGGEGEGGERVEARQRAPTRKTEEAVDRRQNNGSVKPVSPRHCAATSVVRNIAASTAVLGQSHKDNVHCSVVE